jgi:hypothetical protein
MIEHRSADVGRLRERATRSLDERLRRRTTSCGTRWPGSARCRRPRRWSAGTRSCSVPTATSYARPTTSRSTTFLRIRLAEGELDATVREQRMTDELSYEKARTELAAVVERLERVAAR